MKTLPLYPEVPKLAVELTDPLAPTKACTRCKLSDNARTVCMRPEGAPGGLLVVADYPAKYEDSAGRPMAGPTGAFLREVLRHAWTGPLALDNAIKCAPGPTVGTDEIDESFVDPCRPHLAMTLAAVQPTRIFAMGTWAVYAVTGRRVSVLNQRRGYTWAMAGETPVPVFFFQNPVNALRNRFVRKILEEDLRWACAHDPPVPPQFGRAYHVVTNSVDAAEAADALRAEGEVAYDTETRGLLFDGDFKVVSAAVAGGDSLFVWPHRAMHDPSCVAPLREALRDPAVKVIAHNAKFDHHATREDPLLATWIRTLHADTRLWRRLLEGDVAGDLATAAESIGMGGHKDEAGDLVKKIARELKALATFDPNALTKTGKPKKPPEPRTIREIDPDAAFPETMLATLRAEKADPESYAYGYLPDDLRARYNARDAWSTLLLYRHYAERMAARPDLTQVWEKVQRPAIYAWARAERRGLHVDRAALDAFTALLESELVPVRAHLAQYGEINFNSTPQVRAFLFGTLKLTPTRMTDGGKSGNAVESTAADVLEELAGKHPAARALMEMRSLVKLKGQYADGVHAHIREGDAVHTSVLIDGAGTGRPSSTNPNLFNIVSPEKEDPREAEHGRMARNVYCARPGYLLLEGDYAQIELRVAAMLSQDPLMCDLFRKGADLHLETARRIAPIAWKIPPEKFDTLDEATRKGYRRIAKTINFSLLYGKTAEGLAMELNCSVAQAQTTIDAILGTFTGLKKYMDALSKEAHQRGGVSIVLDGAPANWRWLIPLGDNGSDRGTRARVQNAENGILNSVVQGSASHFCARSLGPIQHAFDENGLDAHFVLSVYDSIMVEVAEGDADDAERLMRAVMTGWESYGVPLEVDFKRGRSWGSLAKTAKAPALPPPEEDGI